MAIAKFNPVAEVATKPALPRVHDKDFKSVVVDERYEDLKSLASHVEGYPEVVTYYGQVVSAHSDVREVDPLQSAVYQQYSKIVRLQVRVSDPLTLSYDDDSSLGTVTGTANIFPFLVPNTYDYWVAKTTRNRDALFRITNVTRKSMNRDSIHTVDYQMVGYIDEGNTKVLYDNLEKKTTNTFYFNQERMAEGRNPLLRENENNNFELLAHGQRKVINYFFETFFARSYKTFLVPCQTDDTYDKFLVDFLLMFVNNNQNPLVSSVKQYSYDHDRFMKQPTIWKAFSNRESMYIDTCNRKMLVVGKNEFFNDPYIAGAGVTSIQAYIYPVVTEDKIKSSIDLKYKSSGKDPVTESSSFFSSELNKYGSNQIFKPTFENGFYVLSESFYTNSSDTCLFEKIAWDYLEDRSINLDELVSCLGAYYKLPILERFYYGPLIILFIRDTQVSQITS